MAAPAQYDRFADLYTRSTASSLHNAYIERPAMLGLIGDVSALHVLDLGCGSMVLGARLLEAGAASITGIDASKGMLRLAKARISPEREGDVSLIQHDLNEPFDLTDRPRFDLVTSSLVIHYLEKWQPILTSALKHLKPGGRFIISCHHPFADWLNHPEVGSYHGGPTLISEKWKTTEGEVIELSFYRRSLAVMCGEFHKAGWLIERIVEPQPTQESKNLFESERWNRVASKPSFIIFVLSARG